MTDAAETLSIDAFIEARLADWEKAANDAAPGWAVDVLDSSEINGAIGGYAADLLLLHDPATVLREVARNRRVLERHRKLELPGVVMIGSGGPTCAGCGVQNGYRVWPCAEVRDLASIWSNHPDFRAEWSA